MQQISVFLVFEGMPYTGSRPRVPRLPPLTDLRGRTAS